MTDNLRKSAGETMQARKVLLLDDVPSVAEYLARRLTEAEDGFPTTFVTNAHDLIKAISNETYWALSLDVGLGDDISIRQAYDLVEAYFGARLGVHEELLDTLPARPEDPVNGNYLLGIVRELFPNMVILITTGMGIEKYHHFYRKMDAHAIPKYAEDPDLPFPNKHSEGLLEEILAHLQEKAELDIIVDDRKKAEYRDAPRSFDFEAILRNQQERFDLESFLRSHIQEWPEEYSVKGEILYFNRKQKLLEQIAQVGFTSTLDFMKIRYAGQHDGVLDGGGICGFAAAHLESVLAPHVLYDRRYLSVVEGDETKCELAVPLVLRKQLVGVLNLEADLERAFDYYHVRYFEGIASKLALIIEHETYRYEAKFLQRVIPSLATCTSRDQILICLLDNSLELAGVQTHGCVLVPPAEGDPQSLEVVASRGLDVKPGQRLALESLGVIKEAMMGETDYAYWSVEEGMTGYVDLAKGINSEYVKVLRVQGEVLAVLNLESSLVAISERYQRAVDRLADYVIALLSGMIQKSKEEQQIGRQMGIDLSLQALGHEIHAAKGTFESLLREFGSEPQFERSDILRLGDAIRDRLSNVKRLMVSFLETSRQVNLRVEIFDYLVDYADRIGVKLDVVGESVTVMASGTAPGFRWLFENLVLNTKKHYLTSGELSAAASKIEAFVCIGRNASHTQISYWDSGVAPDNADRLLNDESGTNRQGIRDIQNLCKRYDWDVSTRRHEGGGLCFDFAFRGV
jgi:GAF domain-containing protein